MERVIAEDDKNRDGSSGVNDLTCWYVGAHFVESMLPGRCSLSLAHNPPHANNPGNNDTHTVFRENFRNGYCDVFSGTEPRSIPSDSLLI